MLRASARKRVAVDYKENEDLKPVISEIAGTKRGLNRAASTAAPKPKKRKIESAQEPDEIPAEAPDLNKKRKVRKNKEEDAMPLAERTATASLKKAMYIGAHVSAAGGVQNAITNALYIGANAFALFMKSQRKWQNPPITAEAKDLFLSNCKTYSYDASAHALPHGSYLVNLAQADDAKADQAYTSFLDDLNRCEKLGIKLYNFHPGNTGGDTKAAACGRIAVQLNRAHKANSSVITVLENMAGSGNVVGSTFEDLRDIITHIDDKSRVGVCIDTCHAFAAGYDLRTPETFKATMKLFDDTVGMTYLKAFHLNDSKAPFGSHRDLHANIGTGFLGLRAFHCIMNHDGFAGMPMVLETPIERKDDKGKSVEDKQIWADEIKLLESLVGMDADGDGFKKLEVELQKRGHDERNRIQDQVDRKVLKDAKAKTSKRKKKGGSDAESD